MGGTDRVARAGTWPSPASEFLWASHQTPSRMPLSLSNSRQIPKATRIDFLVRFCEKLIEPTRFRVIGDLSIPIVISPAVKHSLQFRALRERELFDGGFDFLHRAHEIILADAKDLIDREVASQ